MGWREPKGDHWHRTAHEGRPFLAFGTPRYGPTVERHAIVHFETGQGCKESVTDKPFAVRLWQPLPKAKP